MENVTESEWWEAVDRSAAQDKKAAVFMTWVPKNDYGHIGDLILIKLSSAVPQSLIGSMTIQLAANDREKVLIHFGSTTTAFGEADAAYAPFMKPRSSRKNFKRGDWSAATIRGDPWPNFVLEVAPSETFVHVWNKATMWLNERTTVQLVVLIEFKEFQKPDEVALSVTALHRAGDLDALPTSPE